ncbi:hypothetical protein T11_9005 [Trichinella zimbabwensis]|uniref:Uncharacterized protein n=1 Tax=Trichinella zimbabwensis TaxID=268475 RepID=A0A0V1GIV9_9BILA|nr:hypothetical protein T11_9005 [Trichinella zimbabwensis]
MRKFSVCRWPGSRPGKAAENDFLKFLKNAQHFCLPLARQQHRKSCEKRFLIFLKNAQPFCLPLDPRRHGKVAKNDFLEFLKNAQPFCLPLARQQAREGCEKRL